MARFTGIQSIFLALATTGCLTAGAVDFTGQWQLDGSKSKPGPEPTASVQIAQQGDKITFTRQYKDRDGKAATAHFTCAVGANSCDYDENGHKSKVSLWYNGPELVILKTDGDKRDSTVEWHMKLSDDGKTLNINREVIEPSEEKEALVFNKSESVASR